MFDIHRRIAVPEVQPTRPRPHSKAEQLCRGPQRPAPFPIVLEVRPGYVLIRPGNVMADSVDTLWPR